MTWDGHCGDGVWVKVVYAHWAQKLERERDEARRMWSIHQDKLAELRAALSQDNANMLAPAGEKTPTTKTDVYQPTD